MNPYDVLGIPTLAPDDVAQAAYRRLARKHHPDMGGDGEKFKLIKAAYELIKGGWKPPPKAQGFSGFPNPPQPGPFSKPPPAWKPAPGYEAKRTPPPMPIATPKPGGGAEVTIEIDQRQGFEGCTVPFRYRDKVLDYVVRPGTVESRNEQLTFPLDPMIGQNRGTVAVNIALKVLNIKSKAITADVTMELPLCALGLFTGGVVKTFDPFDELLSVKIQPGHDPSEPIVFEQRGEGPEGSRGKLFVHVKPIFKHPKQLTPNERKQLNRIQEMAV